MAILNDLIVRGESRFNSSAYGLGQIAYGECSTAAATAAKVIAIQDNPAWTLQKGAMIVVKFTYTNSASNVTLNVNNTGAKSIYYNNAVYTGNSNRMCGYAGNLFYYVYDGTYWCWLGFNWVQDSTYSFDGTYNATTNKAATVSTVTGTLHDHLILYKPDDVQRPVNINFTGAKNGIGSLFHIIATSATTTGKPKSDANILQMNWDSTSGFDAQIAIGTGSTEWMQFRNSFQGTWGNWATVGHITGTSAVGGETSGPVYVKDTGEIAAVTSVPVSKGGTGATDAATARTNLGVAAASHNHAASEITSGTISTSRLPTASTSAAGIIQIGTGATNAAAGNHTHSYAASSHNHSASDINSGTLDAARLPNISIDKLVAGTTNTTIPSTLLPSYVDDVLEYAAKASFPATGEAGKIYVDKATNLTWRWGGSDYVEISPSLALGTTSSTAFRGDYGNSAYAHAVTNKGSAFTSGLYKITTNSEGHVTAATAVTKSDITGLGIPGSDTDTKVTNTLATTTKSYITGTGTATTNTGGLNFDTGVYLTTTAGQINATSYQVNQTALISYNATTGCLEVTT